MDELIELAVKQIKKTMENEMVYEESSISVTLQEIEIIKHTLGYDYRNYSFRNDFVTYPTSADGKVCEELVRKGLMDKSCRNRNLIGESCLYYCTEKGKAFIMRACGYKK